MRRSFTPAIAALALLVVLGLPLGAASVAHADVDDFRFSSMDVDYRLARAADGTSRLTTTEKLVAEFPSTDQNHGIRRELVDDYQGHPTDLHVVSVTDGTGRSRPFSVTDGTTVTSRSSDFLHGKQTFVITYTQQDVTLQRASNRNDEFYWDVNGTDWEQSFGRVTARLTVTPELASALTGDFAASSGAAGSTTRAAISRSGHRTVTAEARDLGPHENLTLDVGFTAGTFTSRRAGLLDSPWSILAVLGALLALAGLALAVRLRRGRLADSPGRSTVVAEYTPPTGISLVYAGHFARRSAITAELLDLVVTGHVRLEESTTGRKKGFILHLLSADGVDPDGLVYLRALFGDPPAPGSQCTLPARNQKAVARIQDLTRSLPERAVREGYRKPYDRRAILPVLVAAFLGAAVALVFGIMAVGAAFGGAWPVVAITLAIVAAAAAPILVVRRPLTARGADLRDHLSGLRLYVSQAESSRLAFSQSPDGAQRVAGGNQGVSTLPSPNAQPWLRLNEALLPWAALFGEQKRWSRELGLHYDKQGVRPGWYSGRTAFTPAVFATGIGQFGAASVSSFSSSSGGSTGGVFSGGGGGGGGGGGV